MPEKHTELFWLIRQKDDILIFSDSDDVIQQMVNSLHTNNASINEWTNKKADLILIDKNIDIDDFKLIKNHLKPDSKIIIHKNNKKLNEILSGEDLFFEQEYGDYNVFYNNFLNPSELKFVHPLFEKYYEKLDTNLCSFSKHYFNPYIYRSLIQIGTRIENEKLLKDLCSKVIETYPENTPDKGGCFCVLGYKKFNAKAKDNDFFNQIEFYCQNNLNSQNPHVIRWIISLYFLLGIYFQEIINNKKKAIKYFEKCYNTDYKKFNSLICTKQVLSCANIGYLYLSEYKNPDMAKEWFKKGIDRTKEAICMDLNKTVGDDGYYIPFGFIETSELCDIASQCVFAYNNAEIYSKNRTAFDNGFNKKRFGLITYCQKLEKELTELKNKGN